MKVDSPPPVFASHQPTPGRYAEESSHVPALPSSHSQETSIAPSQPAPLVTVNYQLAENGHKVYFQVIDQDTGQVLVQVPSEAVLRSEEQLYDFLQEQAKRVRISRE